MKLSEELTWRGFINQTTIEDLSVLDTKKWTFYHGFDASSDSQTIGNLAAMMFDRAFMRHGHKAIIVAGGATSLIGDPGGKDSERVLQDEETIAGNVKSAEQQLKKVYAGYDYELVNNLDWTKDLKVIDYLRDIGKHFSMTSLVQRDYIAKRIGEGGSGISYTEFSYALLQGLDYLRLYDKYGCTLQLGGSDQWGNCLSGVELIRKARSAEAHVITLPLIINKATGVKFGKSEEGAVWLDPKKTSIFKFYQFWLNVDDDGVGQYLKIYTELNKQSIAEVMTKFEQDKAGRHAQNTLAFEVTKLVHGEDAVQAVVKATQVLFGEHDIHELSATEVSLLKQELNTVSYQGDLIDALVKAGLATSNSEAVRLIDSGAISINGSKINNSKVEVEPGVNLMKKGKNTFALVEN